MSPSATPEQNTPRVLSVASDCPKISGVYFGPPEVLQTGEGARAAGEQDAQDDQH
jgi:hypothetical protein